MDACDHAKTVTSPGSCSMPWHRLSAKARIEPFPGELDLCQAAVEPSRRSSSRPVFAAAARRTVADVGRVASRHPLLSTTTTRLHNTTADPIRSDPGVPESTGPTSGSPSFKRRPRPRRPPPQIPSEPPWSRAIQDRVYRNPWSEPTSPAEDGVRVSRWRCCPARAGSNGRAAREGLEAQGFVRDAATSQRRADPGGIEITVDLKAATVIDQARRRREAQLEGRPRDARCRGSNLRTVHRLRECRHRRAREAPRRRRQRRCGAVPPTLERKVGDLAHRARSGDRSRDHQRRSPNVPSSSARSREVVSVRPVT